MSVCYCGWDSECIGDCVMRERIARSIPKRGNICLNCKTPVEIGQECVDHAGLDCDGGRFFNRFHRQCFDLMELFGDRVCAGGWHYPFDLVEGAEHALAHGDEPFWREWLMQYEKTWAWTPEPPDPEPLFHWTMGAEKGSARMGEMFRVTTTRAPHVEKFEKEEVPTTRADCRVFKEPGAGKER